MDRKDKTLESVMILVGMILNIRSTTIKTLDFDLEMLPESQFVNEFCSIDDRW